MLKVKTKRMLSILVLLWLNVTIASTTKYTVVDLFAGVGGLSHGLVSHPGFKVILANEIDSDIAKAYTLNHPNVVMLTCGIEEVSASMLQKVLKNKTVDLVVGGPPCQSFSTAGKRRMDGRANLFKEYIRILKILNPKAFVFENVRGLLSMDSGRLLLHIKKEFENAGYNVKYKLLDAANYGVPQHRERVIIVGMKSRNIFEYPPETHGMSKGLLPWITVGDALGDLPQLKSGESSSIYITPPQNRYQAIMRKNTGDVLTEHYAPKNGAKIIRIMETLKEGQDKTDLPEEIRPSGGFANTYGKMWWDKPSGTITRNFATPSSARCIHPRDSRALSIREGARLQSFPDDYTFYGNNEKKRLEIGNAVPPLLAAALAEPIFRALSAIEEEK